MMEGEGSEPAAGYKRPPTSTRFVKGRSGNPRGRPKSRHRVIPYDSVLGQIVTIREEGRERRVTAAEAFILQLTRKGLQGDSAAARASLTAIEAARATRQAAEPAERIRVLIISYGVGVVLSELGMGIKRNPLSREKVYWQLKPWIVQAALDRLGERVLTPDEQNEVWSVTHQRDQIRWPQWWTERGWAAPVG